MYQMPSTPSPLVKRLRKMTLKLKTHPENLRILVKTRSEEVIDLLLEDYHLTRLFLEKQAKRDLKCRAIPKKPHKQPPDKRKTTHGRGNLPTKKTQSSSRLGMARHGY